MPVSAVDRVPVEIWSHILARLVRSPLIPHPDATLAESMLLFSTQCDSYRLARDLAQRTGRLRRVCRSWDTFVRKMQPGVVYCNFEPHLKELVTPNVVPYPSETDEAGNEHIRHELLSAQRIEGWMPDECFCGHECRQSPSFEGMRRIREKDIAYKQSRSVNPQNSFIPSQDLAQLEILTLGRYKRREDPTSLFERLPNLKALAWPDDWSELFLNTVNTQNIYQRLTHLKMEVSCYEVHYLERPVDFHFLQFLDLTVSDPGEDDLQEPDQLDLGSWATFPALRKLRLSAYPTEGRQGGIDLFLKRVGPKLTGLILELPKKFRPWFTTEIWALFPSLVEFGYENDPPTTDHSPPPASMAPLNLLYQLDNYSFEASLDDLIQTCQMWRTKQLTMLETWDEAETFIAITIREGYPWYLPIRIEFYEMLGALGIEISDRDGIRVTDPPGVRFLEALSIIGDEG